MFIKANYLTGAASGIIATYGIGFFTHSLFDPIVAALCAGGVWVYTATRNHGSD